jgi:hypothetical protein
MASKKKKCRPADKLANIGQTVPDVVTSVPLVVTSPLGQSHGLTYPRYCEIWGRLSNRGRANVRERADAFGVTLWRALDIWPHLREEK